MAVFKCKMCGGDLVFQDGATVAECDSCGTKQTLPKLTDEKRANLYDRANHFRRNNQYDKAMSLYEQILNEDTTDAEAYWSIVLCRYGIEYVEDPTSHKRIPTINRMQYTSVLADEDYKCALEHADGYQRDIYEQEAKAIDKIQKGILEVSAKEEPFDVFICYKETDANGRRTPDSVLAQELYYELKEEGFKVFFARITLEDKLGSAYEPYIFAALNSSKVMVALGTKAEHFNAVWVKNEWSRYLALIQKGEKKVLIPAYRDMDPYNLPEEFSHLQAQDMSKLGFMQDLVRGIKKLAKDDKLATVTVKETVVTGGAGGNIKNILKRASMFLADGDFDSAKEYCERALDLDPENADAYLYRLLHELRLTNKEALASYGGDFSTRSNYKKAYNFGDDKRKAFLEESLQASKAALEEQRRREQEQRERIAAENEKRNKISSLYQDIENDKNELNRINAQLSSAEATIERCNYRMQEVDKKVKKGKIGALLHILGWVILIVGAVMMVEAENEEALGFIALLWLVLIIVGLVMMMKNKLGKDYTGSEIVGHVFLMMLYDINGIVFTFGALFANKKKMMRDYQREKSDAEYTIEYETRRINKLKNHMQQCRQEIESLGA